MFWEVEAEWSEFVELAVWDFWGLFGGSDTVVRDIFLYG